MWLPVEMLDEHRELTRRGLLKLSALGATAGIALRAHGAEPATSEELRAAIDKLEYLTPQDDFRDVSRGKPVPHSLPEDRRKEVGLTRDTWRLEVDVDPDNPATIDKPLTAEAGSALDFDQLMKLAQANRVRVLKVMTCNNIGVPLGMGLWEGVPLRDIVWLTGPKENLRRVYYYGFHNDEPDQRFQSSLPVGRVLEDPPGFPPVLLCYKLNGDWLTPERGGPVRVLVPESYGFKNVKWLQHVKLSNLFHANDTYAKGNNDIDSWLKTFAHFIGYPTKVQPGEPIAVTGLAQVGLSGLSRVEVWVRNRQEELPDDDPHFTRGDWQRAQILSAPEKNWGGGLPASQELKGTYGVEESGGPKSWPQRFTIAHWAVLLPGLPEGRYEMRCRTIDSNGYAQPMPRPFAKSGRCDIERVPLRVQA